jgi:hypothetical protein
MYSAAARSAEQLDVEAILEKICREEEGIRAKSLFAPDVTREQMTIINSLTTGIYDKLTPDTSARATQMPAVVNLARIMTGKMLVPQKHRHPTPSDDLFYSLKQEGLLLHLLHVSQVEHSRDGEAFISCVFSLYRLDVEMMLTGNFVIQLIGRTPTPVTDAVANKHRGVSEVLRIPGIVRNFYFDTKQSNISVEMEILD